MLLAIEAKAHGLWLSGKLIWVSLKGEPWLLVEGEGNAVSLGPRCCPWMLPAGAFRGGQEPAAPSTARDPATELDVRSI